MADFVPRDGTTSDLGRSDKPWGTLHAAAVYSGTYGFSVQQAASFLSGTGGSGTASYAAQAGTALSFSGTAPAALQAGTAQYAVAGGWVNLAAGSAIVFSGTDVSVVPDGTTLEIKAGAVDAYTKLLLHLDADFSDSSSSGHIALSGSGAGLGMDAGFPTISSGGKFGNAADYTWAAPWVFRQFWYTTGPGAQVGTTDFLVDCWVKYGSAGNHVFSFSRGGEEYPSLTVGDFSGRLSLYRAWGPPGPEYIQGPTISLGVWYHTALMRKAGEFKLAVDGTVYGSWTPDSAIDLSSPEYAFTVGNKTENYLSEYFVGRIDEVRISANTTCGDNETRAEDWWNGFTPPTAPYSGQSTVGVKDSTFDAYGAAAEVAGSLGTFQASGTAPAAVQAGTASLARRVAGTDVVGTAPYAAAAGTVWGASIFSGSADWAVQAGTALQVSGTIPASQVIAAYVGTGCSGTALQTLLSTVLSAGVMDNLEYVTRTNGTTVACAAGCGLFRTSNEGTAPLVLAQWAGSTGITIPVNGVRYIGAQYNAGAPQVAIYTSFASFDWNTSFPIAKVYQDGVDVHIVHASAHSNDTPNATRKMLRQCFPFQVTRAPEGGGLILSNTGTRNFAMTAGTVWHGFNDYGIPAVDTSAGGTFTRWIRDGGSLHLRSGTGLTQWDSNTYDDNTGTVGTLSANKFACKWWYVEAEDGAVNLVLGRGQYNTAALAEAEAPPATLPFSLNEHGVLLGRFIFQKGGTGPVSVQSALTTVFQTQGVTTHNDLGGLNVGDYQHLTAAELGTLQAGSFLYAAQAGTAQTSLAFNGTVPAATQAGTASLARRVAGTDVAGTVSYAASAGTVPGITAFSGSADWATQSGTALGLNGNLLGTLSVNGFPIVAGTNANINVVTTGTGATVFSDSEVRAPIFKDIGERVNAMGTVLGTTTIDLTLGNVVTATATGTVQWSVTNPTPSPNSCTFTLRLTNGGVGAQTWMSGAKWAGTTAPTLTASGRDRLAFTTEDGGTTWDGVLIGATFA